MLPSQPIVFFHIPKTAGTTLSTVFEGIFSGQPQFLAARNGSTHVEDCLRFINLSEDDRRRYCYITGHLEIPILNAIPNNPFVFTFLRNPGERLMSLYLYVKRTPSHHVHPWIAQRNASPEDFIMHCPWDELRNGMTRRLAGVPLLPTGDHQVLRQAIFNLSKYFGFVGLQESFDKSLFCLGRLLGIDPGALVYSKHNVHPDPKSTPKLDEAVKDKMLCRNSLDVELYAHCGTLFRKQSARLLNGAGLKEFVAFKRLVKAKPRDGCAR